MPITSLFCPLCAQEFSDLGHWDSGPCKASAMQRSWWQAMLENQLLDARHRNGQVTVTRLLGCPREWMLQDFLPTMFHPHSSHTPHVGTLVQAAAARACPDGWVAEREVKGKLFGLEVSASIDLSKMEVDYQGQDACMGRICEGKFHSTDKDGYKPWTLKADHAVQVNMQRLLWEQQEPGLKVVEMKLSRASMVGAGKEMPSWDVPPMSEEQIMQHRPGGGVFTVGQIAGMIVQALHPLNEATDMEGNIKAFVPLVGRSQFNEKKCTAYCNLGCKRLCDEMEGIGGGKW